VENKLHTISIGQSTHQDFVQKSTLRRILFDKSYLRRIFFSLKIWPAAHLFHKKIFFLMILGWIWSKVSYSVYQFIGGENDSREAFKRSASVDMICVTRRDRDSGEQLTWIKQSLPQRYVCVGCQLNSDQALRLLCLKGTSERVTRRGDGTVDKKQVNSCALKYLFLEGIEQPKNRRKTLNMLSPTRC